MNEVIAMLSQANSALVALLSATWFSTAIALVGGFLGIVTFLTQLPKQLRPIVVQHGDLDFLVQERGVDARKWTELTGIEFSLILSNSKKAFGIVEDIFCRIYTSESFSPDAALYYASAALMGGDHSDFEPVVLGPEAKVSLRILFGEVESRRSNKVIDLKKNYIVDVFYKLRGRRKALHLPSIHTGTFEVVEQTRLRVTNISRQVARSRYENRLTPLTNDTYKGIVGFSINHLFSNAKYYGIVLPRNYFVGLFEICWTAIRLGLSWLIERFWMRPLVIHGAKKVRTLHISLGDTKDRKIIQNKIYRIGRHIRAIVVKVNNRLGVENQINAKIDNHRIELERFGKKVRVYASGDSTITVDDEQTENTISFTFSLKKNKWGIRVFTNNGTVISTHGVYSASNYLTVASGRAV